MIEKQASELLAEAYSKAPYREKALSIHLFAIKYADSIANMSAKNIVVGAGLQESYKSEIRKGINLSKYVKLK